MYLCDYGCGKKATHKFKNGKWCCSKNVSLCEKIKEDIGKKNKNNILSENHKRKISNTLKGKRHSKETRLKMSIARKGKKHPNYGKNHSEETIMKMSISSKGKNNHNHWKINYTKNEIPLYDTYANQLSIEELSERDKKDKNILTVICTFCKKRFIPNINAIRNRVRSLKGTSDGECRIYCSEECKEECQIFNRSMYPKHDNHIYTSSEYQTFRQHVLERDDYICQFCGEKATDVHHERPQKLEPFFALDPYFAWSCCEKCHYEKGHKDECSTGKLSNIICK